MNRYDIHNPENGANFQIIAEKFPDKMEPEWGDSPVIVTTDITADIAAAKQAADELSAAKERFMKISTSGMTAAQKDQYALLSAIIAKSAVVSSLTPARTVQATSALGKLDYLCCVGVSVLTTMLTALALHFFF